MAKVKSNQVEEKEVDLTQAPIAKSEFQEDNSFEEMEKGIVNDSENDGWEDVSSQIQVWDKVNYPEIIGYNCGQGKTLGEGAKASKTYVLRDLEGNKHFIIQSKAVEALGTDTELGAFIYRLRFKGTSEMKDGSTFHVIDVAKKRAEKPLTVNQMKS